MRAARALLVALLLGACGGDGGSAPASGASSRAPTAEEAQRLGAAAQLLAHERPDDVDAVLAPLLAAERPLPDAQYLAGWAAYQLRDYGRCVELMEAALEGDPAAWWLGGRILGFAHYHRGDYARAAEVFERTLTAPVEHPPDGEVPAARVAVERCRQHYGLGLVELTRGRLERAREHLERALELDPGYLKAQKAWADLLAEEGAPEAALAAVDALLAEWPTHEEALHLRAQVLARLGREDEAEAAYARWREVYDARAEIDGLQRLVQEGRDTPATWLAVAERYLSLGDLREARRALVEGGRRHPGAAELAARLRALEPAR